MNEEVVRSAGRMWRRTGRLVAFALLLAVAPVWGESIVLSGLVKAGDRPLGGAMVELLPLLREQGDAELWLSGKFTPEPLARASSDARGSYAITVGEPGNYRLRITAPGRVPMAVTLSGVVESRDLPVAVLPREQPLTLAVRSGDGQPISDAWVCVSSRRHSSSSWGTTSWWADERRGKTGAQGEVRLGRVAGESLEVEVFRPGYLPVDRELRSAAGTEVRLEAAPAVAIVVNGPDRAPRPGAIALVGAAKWPLGPADREGRLAVPSAGKRSLELVVRTSAGERAVVALPAAPAPDGAPRQIALTPPRSITGRVLSDGDHNPIAGAVVWGLFPAEAVRSDRNGTYRLTELSQEFVLVNAAAPGYLRTRADVIGTLGDSAIGPTLALQRAATLPGRVVDRAGRPLAEVEISTSPVRTRQNGYFSSPAPPASARTALDGSFRLAGVAAGVKIDLRAVHPEAAPWREELAPLPAGANPPKLIVLESGRVAVGSVQDAEKRPVAGATVELFEAPEETARLPWEEEEPVASGPSDSAGRFALAHVVAGRYDLHVRARGFAPLRVPGLSFEPSAESQDVGTVTLGPGAVLEGRVVDASGKAIEGAALYVDKASSSRSFGRFFGDSEVPANHYSAADGSFRFDDLEPGRPVTLTAELEGLGTTVLNRVAVPRDEPLVVVLSPLGTVAGRVSTADGKPIVGALVNVFVERTIGQGSVTTSRRPPFVPLRTGEDGRFRADDVEAGRVLIGAGGEGWASTSDRVELAPGQVIEDFEITLSPGARVVGQVLGPDGEPRRGATVMGGPGRSESALSRSDGDGRFSLDGLPLGRCRVTATDRELGQIDSEVDVVAGENRTELRFSASGEVAGRVLSFDGTPLGQAAVELRRVGGMTFGSRTASTSPDGAFRFSALAAGLYELSASAERYAVARLPEPLRVTSTPIAGLELRLGSGGSARGRVLGLDLSEMPKVRVQASHRATGTYRTATLDYAGQFRIEHLAIGEWVVSAIHGGDSRTVQRTLTISGEGSEVDIELELPKGLRLSGRAIRNGSPIRDAEVMLRARERPQALSQPTDPDGRFSFAGLAAGSFDLFVRSAGARLHEEELQLAGDREIVIDLSEAESLFGQVVDSASRRGIADARLVLSSATSGGSPRGGLGSSYASSDGGGNFRFADLSPGSYQLRIDRDGYEVLERAVEVTAQSVGDPIVVELVATTGLTLEVRSETGGVPEAVRVALRGADGQLVAASTLNPDELGRARLGTAPRGNWEILVQSDDSALTRATVVAPGGPVAVLLPTGAALDVVVPALAENDAWVPLHVVDSQGRPLEVLWGALLRSEWRLSRGRTRLVGLTPGRWEVSAELPDGGEVKASVVAVSGALTTVTLE